MRVQVIERCLPHPAEEVEAALRAAGRQLARSPNSVSVEVRPRQPLTAVLELEMRRAAQYKVVDEIHRTVKDWTWQFRDEITIGFPKEGENDERY